MFFSLFNWGWTQTHHLGGGFSFNAVEKMHRCGNLPYVGVKINNLWNHRLVIIYLSMRRFSIAMASSKQQLHFQNLNKTTGNIPRRVPECARSPFLTTPPKNNMSTQKRDHFWKGNFTFQPFIFRNIILMGGVPNSDFQDQNTTAVGSFENKCAMLAAMLQRHHMRLPMDMATWKANLIWKTDQINSFTTSWLHTKWVDQRLVGTFHWQLLGYFRCGHSGHPKCSCQESSLAGNQPTLKVQLWLSYFLMFVFFVDWHNQCESPGNME